jgi:hypothetical protein
MKVVCSWCGKVMIEGDGEISHGICESCMEKGRKGELKWEDEREGG